jgi:NADH-quinone oxidoreductase subunit C
MTAVSLDMSLNQTSERLRSGVPGCRVDVVLNGSPSGQHSLLIDREHGLAAARLLRDELHWDFCSNVTAVDWLPREKVEKIKTKQSVEGMEKEVEETRKTTLPGYLEVVYHLFSVADKGGPLILRLRTPDRHGDVTLPSLTPVWRSAEFQEREAFDLFGIVFDGHPDLRRILMWDDFTDHPMRKDYVPPADEEREEPGPL